MTTYDPNFTPTKHYARVGQKIIVTNKQGELLLLQRSSLSGLGGKWSLPGGALEQGEDTTEGILRELREETNLVVDAVQPFCVFSRVHKKDTVVIIAYSAECVKGDIELNWEHDAFSWVSREVALDKDLTEDAERIIRNWGL